MNDAQRSYGGKWGLMKSAEEIWLDFLCVESLVLILSRFSKVKTVHYCQKSVWIRRGIVRLIEKWFKITFNQIHNFVYSREHIEGESIYEKNHREVKEIADKVAHALTQDGIANEYIRENGLNRYKIYLYFKELIFYHILRPVEMKNIALRWGDNRGKVLLLRRNIFLDLIRDELKVEKAKVNVELYKTYISHFVEIEQRPGYFYDRIVHRYYYQGRVKAIMVNLKKAVSSISFLLLHTVFTLVNGRKPDRTKANIGCEYLHSSFRPNQINDLFWLKDSGIDPGTVYSIEAVDLPGQSASLLGEIGLNRIRIRFSIKHFCHFLLNVRLSDLPYPPFASPLHTAYSLFSCGRLIWYFFQTSRSFWLNYYLINFVERTRYWFEFYSHFNIRIVFKMGATDHEKLMKSQALDLVGGFLTGGHWSNVPILVMSDQMVFDIFFVWSDYFINNLFDKFPKMLFLVSGYPLDFYFEEYSDVASELRGKHRDKFIICYMDNIGGNDIPYSNEMNVDIYNMLADVATEYSNVVLFLKPKRRYYWESILEKAPKLKNSVQKGRTEVFLGDTESTKAVPALVGKASDVVVGLGISTAATECAFAGTLAYYAELTQVKNNPYCDECRDKILFNDVLTLKVNIIDCLENGCNEKLAKYSRLYNLLDPFQDGQAYRRIGYTIKRLQELIRHNSEKEEVLDALKRDYMKWLSDQGLVREGNRNSTFVFYTGN